jgi:AP-3 complex subunit delta-1
VLVRLAYAQSEEHAVAISGQLLDVAVRVEAVRSHAVRSVLPLLTDGALTSGASSAAGEVLFAGAWVVGEYAPLIQNEQRKPLLQALLQASSLTLSSKVQAAFVQCCGKVMLVEGHAALSSGDDVAVAGAGTTASQVYSHLQRFVRSSHVTVQERASVLCALLSACGVTAPPALNGVTVESGASAGSLPPPGMTAARLSSLVQVLASTVIEPLKAVSNKASKRVQVPEGLDLDAPIVPDTVEMWAAPSTGSMSAALVSFDEAYSTGGSSQGLSRDDLAADFGGDSDEGLFDDLTGKRSKKSKKDKKEKKSKKSKKRGSSMFMLGGAEVASNSPEAGSDADLDDIPIAKLRLTEVAAGAASAAGAGASTLPSAKRNASYVVDLDGAESEGSDSGQSADAEDALAAIDLTGAGTAAAGAGSASKTKKKKKSSEKKAKSSKSDKKVKTAEKAGKKSKSGKKSKPGKQAKA